MGIIIILELMSGIEDKKQKFVKHIATRDMDGDGDIDSDDDRILEMQQANKKKKEKMA